MECSAVDSRSPMNISDVMVRTITTGSIACVHSFTKITVDSLMDSFDVSIMTTTRFEGGFTNVTVESLTPTLTMMDSFDVVITTTTGCEGSVTFTAAMYFLHFYSNTMYRIQQQKLN